MIPRHWHASSRQPPAPLQIALAVLLCGLMSLAGTDQWHGLDAWKNAGLEAQLSNVVKATPRDTQFRIGAHEWTRGLGGDDTQDLPWAGACRLAPTFDVALAASTSPLPTLEDQARNLKHSPQAPRAPPAAG